MTEEITKKPLLSSFSKKILALCGVLTLSTIPKCSVESITEERQKYQEQVAQEIASGFTKDVSLNGNSIHYELSYKHPQAPLEFDLWPTKSLSSAKLDVSERKRGIFKVQSYVATVDFEQEFLLNRSSFLTTLENNNSEIGSLISLNFFIYINSCAALLESQISVNGMTQVTECKFDKHGRSALQVNLLGSFQNMQSKKYVIKSQLKLRGFNSLQIVPSIGGEKLNVSSNWTRPSFSNQLPLDYKITPQGFTANWVLTEVSQNSPAVVKIFEDMNVYQLTTRSLKYGFFIVLFLLISFFMYELLSKKTLHFMHYLFLMLPTSVFFLLLLALSEQIGFGLAYAISASAIICMVCFYLKGIGNELKPTLGFALLEGLIFGTLYVILKSEDYALLMGSTLVFIALGVTMYLTRNFKWERLDV